MMILPSVGSTVTKVLLNRTATKAQLTFDDGTTAIIATDSCKNCSTQQHSKIVKNKLVLHSEGKKPLLKKKTTPIVKNVKTRSGNFVIQTKTPEQLEQAKAKVLSRSDARLKQLEEAAMTPSERAGLAQIADAEKNGGMPIM